MKKKIARILIVLYFAFFMIIISAIPKSIGLVVHTRSEIKPIYETTISLYTATKVVSVVSEDIEPIEEVEISTNSTAILDADINLIGLVTMAEAEGECEEGKRLVIDTILNRVDSPYFSNTIEEVIYKKNQFSSIWNGRINEVCVTDEIKELVLEEIESRTNSEVVFFTAHKYGAYGVPLFIVGNHYFSKYE